MKTFPDPVDDLPSESSELPPIGEWWPMLERPLQSEVLEDVSAPLRRVVVRRIFDLCEIEREIPLRPVRLTENERAYLAGWTHSIRW
ncbi:hypothetical protein [Agromyces marinus]|uniref:Uncharacterized protein n=1 Tax=Agromyces marinus TaxID=1389020 RepID=A0ABM8H363_9MICO|nr:hypothetical protein [Agromyces marinus]UIP59696.1 hypothetical protein DSM26151_26100 [Agromyces marinus]BDZ55228.1 hypothetical protein GCM10025870_23010 [Agromyces marinus]